MGVNTGNNVRIKISLVVQKAYKMNDIVFALDFWWGKYPIFIRELPAIWKL